MSWLWHLGFQHWVTVWLTTLVNRYFGQCLVTARPCQRVSLGQHRIAGYFINGCLALGQCIYLWWRWMTVGLYQWIVLDGTGRLLAFVVEHRLDATGQHVCISGSVLALNRSLPLLIDKWLPFQWLTCGQSWIAAGPANYSRILVSLLPSLMDQFRATTDRHLPSTYQSWKMLDNCSLAGLALANIRF